MPIAADHNTSSNSGLIKYQASCKPHKNIATNKCNNKGGPQHLRNFILPEVEKRNAFAVLFYSHSTLRYVLFQKGELLCGNVTNLLSYIYYYLNLYVKIWVHNNTGYLYLRFKLF